MRFLIFLLIVCGSVAGPSTTEAQSFTSDSAPRVRVLFLGNSYTHFNEYPRLFQNLAMSAAVRRLPEIHAAIIPGGHLSTHWQDSMSRAAIRRGGWDYVILQAQSREPLMQPDSTLKYARLLNEEIRSSGAKVILTQHWPRKHEPENREPLHAAIERIASDLQVSTVPIAVAFDILRQRAPQIELYHTDNSHPTSLGSYLAACVLFAFIYDQSPVGLSPYTYTTTYHSISSWDTAVWRIEDSVARLVQETAWEAVRQHSNR